MQFPLAGNRRALMPNCSRFSCRHLVAGRIPRQLVWWFWSSLGLHHASVCSADGLPNLFLFISSAIEFVLFYPLKGKALDKVPHGTDMPTLLLSQNEYKPHSCLKSYIIQPARTHAIHCSVDNAAAVYWIPLPDSVIST